MPQIMLVFVVTNTAKVVTDALGTLPTDAKNGILATTVTFGAVVFSTCKPNE